MVSASGLDGFSFLNQFFRIIVIYLMISVTVTSVFDGDFPASFPMVTKAVRAIFVVFQSLPFAPHCICFSKCVGTFLRSLSWSFLTSCSNVDSLPFRSAVQLQPWASFPLDSWVSAIIFLHISCFPLAFFSNQNVFFMQ